MPVNRERKMVTFVLAPLRHIMNGSIDEAISTLRQKVESYSSQYQNIRVGAEVWDPYSTGECEACLLGDRPETDKEMNKRIAQEEQTEEIRLEVDKREYERLKTKFEKKDDDTV